MWGEELENPCLGLPGLERRHVKFKCNKYSNPPSFLKYFILCYVILVLCCFHFVLFCIIREEGFSCYQHTGGVETLQLTAD